MAKYILLRVENDEDARLLVQDIENNPAEPLLSPSQENAIFATVIKTLGEPL